ncbi:hypothetical protein C8R48DRAFT_673997 [Suillus tomentosus]|nr:hypothetical protein C8R48DRAFT_673997 [Suillus tomentosus]
MSPIICDGEEVGFKDKGKEYYVWLGHAILQTVQIVFSKRLLRSGDLVCLNTPDLVRQICMILMADHAFGGSAKLAFDLDSQCKETEDRLQDVELIFRVGDEVQVVARDYLGLQGHVVQRNNDIFCICQSGTQEQVEVSKYYLECHLIDRTLKIHMSIPTYINLLQESKSIKIGDFLQVLVGDWIGKSGVVQWVSNFLIWFQDEMELLMNDASSHVAPHFIQVEAVMVERTCLSATLEFTKEYGYNVRPEDVISIACGPEFHTEGVVHSMDFINAQLTLETDNEEHTHNIDLDVFNKYMKKEKIICDGTTQSVTPSLERITPSALASSSAITWETQFPEVLAAMSLQNDNASPSTEDSWTVDSNSICWLKAHASQFHNYHALLNGLVGFQGSKLLKWIVYSHCPDPFCGPNGPAPPGNILTWATAKTAGGARVDYQISVKCLTLAQSQKKNQECFIMDGQN